MWHAFLETKGSRMPASRPIHPDFRKHLDRKDEALIELFTDLRAFILELHGERSSKIPTRF